MQHFPKNCFHFPESSVKFASSTKNEVRKFGEVRSSSSTEILICNPGPALAEGGGGRTPVDGAARPEQRGAERGEPRRRGAPGAPAGRGEERGLLGWL